MTSNDKAASEGWTAILLAGQRPGPDALAQAFGVKYKALINVGGMPMVTRVAQTLLTSPLIARVVVLCQAPEVIRAALGDDPRISYAQSDDGISASIAQIAGSVIAPWPLFVTTADHPLLTTQMIDLFLAQSENCDVSVGMVERGVILSAYPDNQRTWIKLRGGAWSGANLFSLSNAKTAAALLLWTRAEKDRKQMFKLFLNFGALIALRAVTRTITLEQGIAALGKRLGLDARAVPLPFAEAAIDVDKLSDHVQVEAILARHAL